jgi:hypothetical protein
VSQWRKRVEGERQRWITEHRLGLLLYLVMLRRLFHRLALTLEFVQILFRWRMKPSSSQKVDLAIKKVPRPDKFGKS